MSHTINIFIVRHGHSDFGAAIDFDRKLTHEGIQAVRNTAEFINDTCKKLSISVDVCISSAAKRTQQTAEILCRINSIANVRFYQELYSTVASVWIDKISNEQAQTLLIVGHNPTFSQLVNVLCGYEAYMKPASCAFIALEIMPGGIIYPAQLNEFYTNE